MTFAEYVNVCLLYLYSLNSARILKAIDFAREQNDDDLWEDLLRYSETRPRELLERRFDVVRQLITLWHSLHPWTARERRPRD